MQKKIAQEPTIQQAVSAKLRTNPGMTKGLQGLEGKQGPIGKKGDP